MAVSKKTPEMIETIREFLAQGCTRRMAAHNSGICEDTFYAWLKDDSEFSETVKRAESEYLAGQIKKVNDSPAWQAAAWTLERRAPDDFALSDQIEKVLKKHGLIADVSKLTAGGKPSSG